MSLTCELIWVKQFLQELNFCDILTMKMYCDNQVVLHIASHTMFHEITKHIDIDCHFVHEKLLKKEICTEFVGSNDQHPDALTKSLREAQIEFICSKLRTYNLLKEFQKIHHFFLLGFQFSMKEYDSSGSNMQFPHYSPTSFSPSVCPLVVLIFFLGPSTNYSFHNDYFLGS